MGIKHIKIIIAFGILFTGIIFLAIRVMPSRHSTGEAFSPSPAAGFVAELDFDRYELRDREDAVSDLDRHAIDIEAQIRQALSQHPIRARPQLTELARNRVLLYIDPDFDRYIEHMRHVSGRQPDLESLTLFGRPLERDRWTSLANRSVTAIDPGTVFVLRGGENGSWTGGGSIITQGCSQGRYSDIPMHEPNTDVIHLAWPAKLPGTAGTYRGLLVLTFAWDRSRGRWVPLASGAASGIIDDDNIQRPIWF